MRALLITMLMIGTGCLHAQNTISLRIVPVTSTTTGLPTAVGTLSFRDLSTGAGKTVSMFAPNTVTTSYGIRLPDTNTAGCLSNTPAGAVAVMSFAVCGTPTIQEEGSALTSRAIVNFIGSTITCVDDGGNARTNCTVDAANPQLSNLGTTAINAHFLPATNNTVDLGTSANEFGSMYAYTSMQSQQIRVSKMSGTSVADYFDWRADSGLFELRDSSNQQIFSYASALPQFYLKGHISPYDNGLKDLGVSGAQWRKLYSVDAEVSALAGVGTRDVCATAAGLLSVTSCPSSGANTQLSNLGTTAINAHLLFGANNTYDIGSLSVQAGSTFAYTQAQSQQFRVAKMTGTTLTDYFDLRADSGLFEWRNSSNVQIFSYTASPLAFTFRGSVLPLSDVTYDSGASGARWATTYSRDFVGANATLSSLAGLGTRCVTASNSGLLGLAGANCGTGTVTSVGQSFTGGIISVSGSPITGSGTLALTVAGNAGGIVYFPTSSTWASTATPSTNTMLFGNGSGAPFFATLNTIYANLLPDANATRDLGASGTRWSSVYANNIVANSSVQINAAAGFGTNCAIINNSGVVTIPSAWGTCVVESRTISTTSPLGGGGDLSANRTLTCTTCVTTAGGQSISGTTTLSTLSVSTAIAGTFNLSGNMTVTGNFYARYPGTSSGISCSGVGNGWMGITSDDYVVACTNSGVRVRAALASY